MTMSTNETKPSVRQADAPRQETPEEAAVRAIHPLFHRMSGRAQRLLLRKYHPVAPMKARRAGLFEEAVALPAAPRPPGIANIRVNSPAEDAGAGNHTTESEPSLAVHGDQIVVGFNDSNPTSSFWGYSTSSDGGKTFVDRGGISGQQSGDAVLAVDRTGNFYYAMLATDAAGHSCIGVSKSTDGGVTFGAPVNASTTANGPDPLFQDKEWLTVDNTGGTFDGNLYVVWTRFTQTTSQIMCVRSTDRGATWSAPLGLSPAADVQGAMPAVGPHGEVYVAWFDGAVPGIQLRCSVDGGVTFTNPVPGNNPVQTINPIPGTMTGNIRADNFPSIAVDPSSGNVYVAYPSRSGADQANVFLTNSTDGGKTWSAPLRVNDDTTTTDQWMPSVAVASNGVVGVMFYDRRRDPAHDLRIDVFLATSADGGKTIRPNRRITTTSFPPAVNFDPGIATNYMGDYNQMVASGTRFLMAWGDNRDKVGNRPDANVYFAVLDA
jgi:hypothetical protein